MKDRHPITAPATLTQSLNALELVTDAAVAKLHAEGERVTAFAHQSIKENAVNATLRLAAAVRAALDGDLAPARDAMRDLRLDQLEIR